MVVLNRIYTRTGDDGTTALGTGERRKKYDLRIASYGTVDELNAAIGLARLATAGDAEVDAMLGRIQNDLFDLGADLCTPETAKGRGPGGERLTVTDAQVTRLEAEIDRLNADLAPLRSFVLPGGTAAAALTLSMTMIGLGLGPYTAGLVSDLTGSLFDGIVSVYAVVPLLVIFGALAATSFWLASGVQ